MAEQKKTQKVVGTYKERPLEEALANPKDIAAEEDRATTDQIADYHQKHKTLKVNKDKPEDAVKIVGTPPADDDEG
jgi:hypothetical protein